MSCGGCGNRRRPAQTSINVEKQRAETTIASTTNAINNANSNEPPADAPTTEQKEE